MIKNVIAFFTISTCTKRAVLYTTSIMYQFERPWALVRPHIFNTTDMRQQNQFFLHPKK